MGNSTKVMFVLGCTALSACGGGTVTEETDDGGPNPIPPQVGTYISLDDTTTTALTQLRYRAYRRSSFGGGTNSAGNAGTLDHDANEILDPGLFGERSISEDRTEIGSSTILSNPADTDHMRIFRTNDGVIDSGQVGVIGQVTVAADIPDAGSSNYTGVVEMTVDKGTETFNLLGDVTTTARWGNGGTVDTTFSNLSVETDSGMDDISGNISITNARISGRNYGYESATLSVNADFFGVLADPEVDGGGRFFGPNASENGAVTIIDDTVGGDVHITALHAANES